VSQEELDHQVAEELAYRFWQERGSPHGSPEIDWYRAQDVLREAALSNSGMREAHVESDVSTPEFLVNAHAAA
jgi:hypothetical protein